MTPATTSFMPKPRKAMLVGPLMLVLGLALSACTGSTSALKSAKSPASEQTDTAGVEETPAVETAKVLNQPSTVSRKGTYIRILVNGDPITNYDIQRRAKFRQLRRLKAGKAETEQELIDERIKLQEAKARGTLAGDDQVNAAFANFAKGNRATPQKMASDLDRLGVGSSHFKEFIRAQMSWSRTVGSKLRSETQQSSQSKAIFDLRKSGASKPQTTEYQLKQIIFVVPQAKRGSLLKIRRQEAFAFRQRFTGCDSAIVLAKELHDVAIKDLGRIMQPQLPAEWKDEIEKTEVNSITQPKETNNGVELIAVCKAQLTSDDKAAELVAQSQAFETIEEKGDAASDEYLAELKKSATIVYK
ncbi:MAG: peptidylprolyl isomerase [Rhizobiaceae bacterium]